MKPLTAARRHADVPAPPRHRRPRTDTAATHSCPASAQSLQIRRQHACFAGQCMCNQRGRSGGTCGHGAMQVQVMQCCARIRTVSDAAVVGGQSAQRVSVPRRIPDLEGDLTAISPTSVCYNSAFMMWCMSAHPQSWSSTLHTSFRCRVYQRQMQTPTSSAGDGGRFRLRP